MASSVGALANHYETLEVSPTATSDEIVQAFASHMRIARMRPDISVVRLAQLSVAYETLRDPAKRRTYDASIGLKREPQPPPPRPSLFMGAPVVARLNNLAERPAIAPARRPVPPAPEIHAEPRIASFIAASLREPVERTEPTTGSAQSAQAEPPSPPEVTSELSLPPAPERLEIEEGRLSVGRTGATLAAGVLGVAILAFAAALPDRNPDRLPIQTAQAEPGLTVPLPPAAASGANFAAVQPRATTTIASASPRINSRPDRAAPARKQRPAQWLALDGQQPAAASERADAGSPQIENAVVQPSPDASPAAETSAVAAEAAPVSAASATLPLPNTTIARTIERIGYGCGRVVSATGVDGTNGVFNITCSSGDTYRASPVRGRYHFRRMGAH
jgi:hypothetical protein